MIDLYTWSTPNGQKASIMLEEIGLPYRVTAVDIGAGDQHHPDFRRISPNGKIPAIVDHDPAGGGQPRRLFESGNILIYLAEKSGQLLPRKGGARTETLGWLCFQTGHLGPMVGQWHWFKSAAPEKSEMAIARYREESLRLLEVMNGRLGDAPYLGGDYSIADVASYAWTRTAVDELREEGEEMREAVEGMAPLCDWLTRVGERPAVLRGMAIPTDRQKEASAQESAFKGSGGA